MTDVVIREAAGADIAAILQAYAEAGIESGDAFTAEEARQHFARFRQYPYYRIFVAEARAEIAGTYALLIMDNLAKRGARSGVVEDVAVRPEWQGHGVGRALMEHARAQCRAAGCYKLTLSSNLEREGAHRFYDTLGFKRHGYSFQVNI